MKASFYFLLAMGITFSSHCQTRERGPWWPHPIWGAQDEAGASNWITPDKIMKALKYAQSGKVYELGHPYERVMPFVGTRSFKLNVVDTGPAAGTNKQLGNEEVISGELGQVGTQFDGPGHIGALTKFSDGTIKGVYYNGFTQEEVVHPDGLLHLGVQNVKPILSRGILIDVAAFKGVNMLTNSYEVTLADVKGALSRQGVSENSITPGDVIIFRYGWARLWKTPAEYNLNPPGIGLEVARWLVAKQICMTGADTGPTEVMPNPNPDLTIPVHQELMMKNGIFNLENMDLESLSADKAYEFLFIFTPIRFVGASGSPGRPIAIR
ncbi:MAG TPA: cyclase family protein [Cyclobacteriaceae bacterium]|nr:cyclase family protein [Cyclobacteriaceae bacterium]